MDNELIQLGKRIDKKLTALTSYRHVFLRGIVNGVGTFLGATIVVGLLFGILSQVIDLADNVDFIRDFIDTTDIDNYVDDTTRSSD